jgi:hypothetical protein
LLWISVVGFLIFAMVSVAREAAVGTTATGGSMRKMALHLVVRGLHDLVTIRDADVHTNPAVHIDRVIGPKWWLSHRGSVADVDITRALAAKASTVDLCRLRREERLLREGDVAIRKKLQAS